VLSNNFWSKLEAENARGKKKGNEPGGATWETDGEGL